MLNIFKCVNYGWSLRQSMVRDIDVFAQYLYFLYWESGSIQHTYVFIILNDFLWNLISTRGGQLSDSAARKGKEKPASQLILKFNNFWRSFLNLLIKLDWAAKGITCQSVRLSYLGGAWRTGEAGKPEIYLQENWNISLEEPIPREQGQSIMRRIQEERLGPRDKSTALSNWRVGELLMKTLSTKVWSEYGEANNIRCSVTALTTRGETVVAEMYREDMVARGRTMGE